MHLFRLFVCCWLLACPLLVNAQSVYRIELIAFEHKNPEGLTAENWSDNVPLAAFNDAIALGANSTLMLDSERQLSDIVAKLNSSPAYRVLLHTAWKQVVSEPASAQAVHLVNGRTLGSANSGYELDGIAKLSAGRFLHLDVEFIFSKLLQDQAADVLQAGEQTENTFLRRFQLKESRRIKSKELNYFDHPLFGIIAVITPVTASQ